MDTKALSLVLFFEMTKYFAGDVRRIQHFVKVHAFAKIIGEAVRLDAETMQILEAASCVHDIGIRLAEEKYGSSDGRLQEREGPAEAEKMLKYIGYDKAAIERVCYLVGCHHTYTGIEGIDHQILVEADLLINLCEEQAGREALACAYEKIFKTESGRRIFREIFTLIFCGEVLYKKWTLRGYFCKTSGIIIKGTSINSSI